MMKILLHLDENNDSNPEEEPDFSANISCQPQWQGPRPDDVLFRTCVTEYFCGQGRSQSPFRE